MRLKTLLLGLLFCQPLLANGIVEHTAIQALTVAKHSDTGRTLEHGGMLVSTQTPYGRIVRYVEPSAPNRDVTSVTVIEKKMLTKNDVLVGSYHLHLCFSNYYHAYFSVQDVLTAFFSGVPEFMLDECTGDIHEFDPLVDKVRGPGGIDAHISGPKGERLSRHLPAGRIIGNIGETETPREGP